MPIDDIVAVDVGRRYIANFKFARSELAALHERYPVWEPEFIEYLAALDTSQVPRGSLLFDLCNMHYFLSLSLSHLFHVF